MYDRFQFLYGTIKRYFDSAAQSALAGFQFLYGTIKRHIAAAGVNNQFNFNSSMVQLNEGCVRRKSIDLYEFQFLYGTIKRTNKGDTVLTTLFQFLYGTIKRFGWQLDDEITFDIFQFLYGTIKRI